MPGAWESQHNVMVGIDKWQSLDTYPMYEVSTSGQIRSVPRRIIGSDEKIHASKGKLLKQHIRDDGYLMVKLYERGGRKSKSVYVHRLVLEAFIGCCPEGMEACHEDGNKTNNNLSNLRWGTPKSNGEDKVRHGTTTLGLCGRHYNEGENSGNAKLTDGKVLEIRRLFATGGYSIAELSRMFLMSYPATRQVIYRLSWKHI